MTDQGADRGGRADPAPSNLAKGGAPETCSLGALPGYVGYNLRRAQVASFRHLERSAGELELSPGQFSLLIFLDANPGVSQKTASREIGVDTSTLSPVLAALSERGLVLRSRAMHDRRNYAISLTPAGQALLADMLMRIEAQETLMGDALRPGEHAGLLDMLRRITTALDRA